MARLGRFFLPDQPLHVIQRGNNRQAIFRAPADYAQYLAWLAEAARAQGCAVHAYALMTNHVHLLLSPKRADSLPRLMQALGRRYVRYVNARYRRTGTLWEGRYRAAPIDSEAYLLACMRYIELNPVRAPAPPKRSAAPERERGERLRRREGARLAKHPRQYRWSSYRANAEGAADPLVAPHAVYRALGRSAASRQAAYRDLFREALDPDFVDELRAATNGGWALGSERFMAAIAKAVGRRVTPLPRGRKPKPKPPADRR